MLRMNSPINVTWFFTLAVQNLFAHVGPAGEASVICLSVVGISFCAQVSGFASLPLMGQVDGEPV